MTASLAFEADVRTQPDNRPLVGAAGVRFAQTEEILKLKVGKHMPLVEPGFEGKFSPVGKWLC
jgi:hypothetical protein